jgi:two-component system sensor histidine kinase SenX3
VTPIAAAVLGAVFGLLAGAAVVVAIVRRPVPTEVRPAMHHDEVDDVIGMLRSAVAMVGDEDDVVVANDAATRLGLVRGPRLALPAVLELVRGARRDGDEASVDLDQPGRPGVPGVRMAVRALPLDGGRVFVVADDRTPALRAAESSRDFMANATHELKTPIGAISLLAEAVEGAASDPEAVTRFAGRIGAESRRLTDLVQQIITLSRLQGRPALASAEGLPVGRVVEDALQRCRPLAEGRGVSLTTSGEPGLWVFGDAAQLATAVENLVQNAIIYSEEKARVAVTTRGTDADGERWVEIAVSDNGIGIAPENAKRVFERFYRVDYARSRESGGTGLGLSIVAEIAAGHGGTVGVWSSPGAGSTFTLRLPAATDTEEGDAA